MSRKNSEKVSGEERPGETNHRWSECLCGRGQVTEVSSFIFSPCTVTGKSIGTQAKHLWCWVRHLRTPLAGWADGIRMVGQRRHVRSWLCGTGSVLGEASSRGGFYVRWLCGRWGTRSFGPRTAGRCRGRTWRSCSSAGPDRRDTWSAGRCRAAVGTGASSGTPINKDCWRSHLLLYVLKLLLELLNVGVHVSIVFVSL